MSRQVRCTNVRISEQMLLEIDAARIQLKDESPDGVEPTRSTVIRTALNHYFRALRKSRLQEGKN